MQNIGAGDFELIPQSHHLLDGGAETRDVAFRPRHGWRRASFRSATRQQGTIIADENRSASSTLYTFSRYVCPGS